MSTATFVLEDDNGAVATKLTFTEGFNKASGAHQAAQMLVKLMDQQFMNLGPVPEKPENVIEQRPLIVVEGSSARRSA